MVGFHLYLPCFEFSVGRAAHLKDETQQGCKARGGGQINRYKANDLAGTTVFMVLFSYR